MTHSQNRRPFSSPSNTSNPVLMVDGVQWHRNQSRHAASHCCTLAPWTTITVLESGLNSLSPFFPRHHPSPIHSVYHRIWNPPPHSIGRCIGQNQYPKTPMKLPSTIILDNFPKGINPLTYRGDELDLDTHQPLTHTSTQVHTCWAAMAALNPAAELATVAAVGSTTPNW